MKPLNFYCILCGFISLPLVAQYDDLNTVFSGKPIQQTIDSLKKTPANSTTLTRLGDLYFSKENYRKAHDYFHRALELDSTDLNRFKLAQICEKLKKYQKALYLYTQVWRKDSLNSFLHYRIAKLEMRLGNYQKAFEMLETLKAKDAHHPVYPYQMGLIKTLDFNYSKAIDYFLESFDRDSLNIDAIYQIAYSFNQLRIKDSTELFLKKGLKLDPDHQNLNRIKINRLSKEKKYDKAIALLLKQDSLYPNEFYNTKMLGLCFFKKEAYDEAATWFTRSYQNNKEDFNSLTYLGHIALKKGEHQDALQNYLLATMVGDIPRDEEYLGLGNVYQQMGKLKKAMEMFEKAYDENKNNDDALFEWALASDRYYKDKTIGYDRYKKYLKRFSHKNDSVKLDFIKSRMGAIKEKLFLKGIEPED